MISETSTVTSGGFELSLEGVELFNREPEACALFWWAKAHASGSRLNEQTAELFLATSEGRGFSQYNQQPRSDGDSSWKALLTERRSDEFH